MIRETRPTHFFGPGFVVLFFFFEKKLMCVCVSSLKAPQEGRCFFSDVLNAIARFGVASGWLLLLVGVRLVLMGSKGDAVVIVATFRVVKLTLQTRELWLVGVATDRNARYL